MLRQRDGVSRPRGDRSRDGPRRGCSTRARIVFTKSGFTARIVASHRPDVPILALTDEPRTFRQLALVWGVIPALVRHCHSYDEMVQVGLDEVRNRKLAQPGDRVILTAGVPFDEPGTTNTLKVERV